MSTFERSQASRLVTSELCVTTPYQHRTSALEISLTLAGFSGLGTTPFHLYRTIAIDELHKFDLCVCRDWQNHEFRQFTEPAYNEGKISKSTFVKVASR